MGPHPVPFRKVYVVVTRPCPHPGTKYKRMASDSRHMRKSLPCEKDSAHNKRKKSKLRNLLFHFISLIFIEYKKNTFRTSLVVQRLRLCAPSAGDPGSNPGQGTRSRMPQLRACMLQVKSLHATTKDSTCGNKDPACRN